MKPLLKKTIKTVVPNKLIHAAIRHRNRPVEHQQIKPTSVNGEGSKQNTSAKLNQNLHYGSDFLTTDWLVEQLKARAPESVKVWFYHKSFGARLSICVLNSNVRLMIDAIIELSYYASLDIKILVAKEWHTPKSYEDLLYTVRKQNFSNIELSGSDRVLKFRIEQWRQEDGVLNAPRDNLYTRRIYLQNLGAGRDFLSEPGRNLSELFPDPIEDDLTFPIDLVYTWVNSQDPDWQELYAEFAPTEDADDEDGADVQSEEDVLLQKTQDITPHGTADRYENRDELRYSLRSIEKFAPWVRNIYVFTNCKPPAWVDTSNPRLKWIYHKEVFEPKNLPTFSSHAIETQLHKLPNLSERFIYFNDDIVFTRPANPQHFFQPNGLARIRLEDYGMVHGNVEEDAPDYLNAARNVQALLIRRFGKTVTQLHTHTPQSMIKSVVENAETDFAENYAYTASQRFRSQGDISPSSFLYPHYAYLSGNAIKSSFPSMLIKSSINYENAFKSVLSNIGQDNENGPLTVCINDGGGSAMNENWNVEVENFLMKAFPDLSQFEKAIE